MLINPEQWCEDLVKEFETDNTVDLGSWIYSADGTILYCELVISDGTVPFLVRFAISNEGYVLAPLIQPKFPRDYFDYGSRGYVLRKNKWRKYTPKDVKYYCISYLTKNLDLKPSVKDFKNEIIKMRNFWLSNDPIPQLVDLRK